METLINAIKRWVLDLFDNKLPVGGFGYESITKKILYDGNVIYAEDEYGNAQVTGENTFDYSELNNNYPEYQSWDYVFDIDGSIFKNVNWEYQSAYYSAKVKYKEYDLYIYGFSHGELSIYCDDNQELLKTINHISIYREVVTTNKIDSKYLPTSKPESKDLLLYLSDLDDMLLLYVCDHYDYTTGEMYFLDDHPDPVTGYDILEYMTKNYNINIMWQSNDYDDGVERCPVTNYLRTSDRTYMTFQTLEKDSIVTHIIFLYDSSNVVKVRQ